MGNNSPLKHGGDKPIQMDYTTFQKKSIQQIVSQQQLKQQLSSQEKEEKSIERYKYHEDFDRISLEDQPKVTTQQFKKQNIYVNTAFSAIFFARVYVGRVYRDQQTFALIKRYYPHAFIFVTTVLLIEFYNSQVNQVINDKYFGQTSIELQKFRALDEQMDLYKYVPDIKYNFDYSRSNILQSRQDFHHKFLAYMEQQIPRIVAFKLNKSKYDQIQP